MKPFKAIFAAPWPPVNGQPVGSVIIRANSISRALEIATGIAKDSAVTLIGEFTDLPVIDDPRSGADVAGVGK